MPNNAVVPPLVRSAKRVFRQAGGTLRMADAIRAGVHRRTLYAMKTRGEIESLSRGLYRLTNVPALGNSDLVTVALKVPRGVVYLISALAYHDLTTQVPHEVCIAIPRNSEPPRLDFPPIRTMRVSPTVYDAGIERHLLDGVTVQVYSREKTLADCFRHRHELGIETLVEALRRYKSQGRIDVASLLHFAGVCRMARVMRPYLESIL